MADRTDKQCRVCGTPHSNSGDRAGNNNQSKLGGWRALSLAAGDQEKCRFGYSFGQLYHENGVVFGEAMVDAYEVEHKHACHPRVLVSDRIIDRLTGIPEFGSDLPPKRRGWKVALKLLRRNDTSLI